MMRVSLAVLLGLLTAGCGDDDPSLRSPTAFVDDQRIVYTDGLHNENTEMIRLGNRILLIFRGGEEGQVGTSRARINVFESQNDGRSFTKIGEVDANHLPDGRDIRDPKLVERNGVLSMYAISRLPGAHYRDLFGQAWTIRADSTDGGHTWTLPVKTYADVHPGGAETYWGFWRFSERTYTSSAQTRHTLFATGYNDGDSAVALFASDDGINWEKRATIISSYEDVPSEAELQFFGANQDKAVALVRLDNQDILADGQTAICTASEPFTTWECGRRIEPRLDGPTWIVRRQDGQPRNFVFARKHLPCTFKRTTPYELRGDLADPSAAIEVCEIADLKSSGDTAYTALAPLSDDKYLLSWYSSVTTEEPPWLEGQFSKSDIWLANIDFSQAPDTCIHPQPKRACTPPPLPASVGTFDIGGEHLFALAPVIWPKQPVYFRAQVEVHGATFDLKLQPLDPLTKTAVGSPWNIPAIPVAADGSFIAVVGTQGVPAESYPVLNDPFLTVNEFVLTGKMLSADAFCGHASGYGQVLGRRVSDRIRLEGSTFAAKRITGATLPTAARSCDDLR